jgi:hypothetical protein
MSDRSYPDTGITQRIVEPPFICAECGMQITSAQIADECEMCGSPRCRTCAAEAGDSIEGHYICSSCAAED